MSCAATFILLVGNDLNSRHLRSRISFFAQNKLLYELLLLDLRLWTLDLFVVVLAKNDEAFSKRDVILGVKIDESSFG